MSSHTGKTAMTRRILMNAMVAGAATVTVPTIAQAAPDSTAELLDLEEQIFSAHEAATVDHAEIGRLHGIICAEAKRIYDEALTEEARQGQYLTPNERWNQALAMPESKEHDRLVRLAQPHYDRVDELIKRMWAIPATTPEGRQAKFLVLLNFVLAGYWSVEDGDWRAADSDWHIRMTRDLMIEFIGGEPAKQLRDQFA
jgi:hypothetical protein